MAKIELLKAGFTGSVGAVTGTTSRGQQVAKSRIWSKAPANETQKNSRLAFEELNRLSSKIAKVFWKYLDLKSNKMLKHNAVARYLKPLIKTHTFEISNIADIAEISNRLKIELITQETDDMTISVYYSSTIEQNYQNKYHYFIAILTEDGLCSYCELPQGTEGTIKKIAISTQKGNVTGLIFAVNELNKPKELIANYQITFISNEIWYTEPFPVSYRAYVEGEILYLPKEISLFAGEVVIVSY